MMLNDTDYVAAYAAETAAIAQVFAADRASQAVLADMAVAITAAMRAGRKLLVAGNGGSAADAQHIAGEFISRLMFDRPPLACIALTTDTSSLTATANDYGYEHVFERQLQALGQPGDVLLGISTSGRSPNIVRALVAARAQGLVTMGFAGPNAGAMDAQCDHLFRSGASDAGFILSKTPLIQQMHIVAAHVICALVERAMFPPPGASRMTADRA